MPKFVIERELPGASKLSEEDIRQASLTSMNVLREMGPDIQWLNSFVCDDKIYCIYFSPDETLLHEHGRRSGMPVSRVEAVRRMIDPASFE